MFDSCEVRRRRKKIVPPWWCGGAVLVRVRLCGHPFLDLLPRFFFSLCLESCFTAVGCSSCPLPAVATHAYGWYTRLGCHRVVVSRAIPRSHTMSATRSVKRKKRLPTHTTCQTTMYLLRGWRSPRAATLLFVVVRLCHYCRILVKRRGTSTNLSLFVCSWGSTWPGRNSRSLATCKSAGAQPRGASGSWRSRIRVRLEMMIAWRGMRQRRVMP